MSKTPPKTLIETGAQPGDILVGIKEGSVNSGLRIKIHKKQPKDKGGNITGSFDLIAAGGAYKKYLLPHVGKSFPNAKELLDLVNESSGGKPKKCMHILQRNELRQFDVGPGSSDVRTEEADAAPAVPHLAEPAERHVEEQTVDLEHDSGYESDARELAVLAERIDDAGGFDPDGVSDARERTLTSIVRRQGQPAFRERLLAAYKGRCAITACDVEAVLEAAHIVPYQGPETNQSANGLLLRADMHTLFDRKLISVDVEKMTVLVSSRLDRTCYEELRGRPIAVPDDPERLPSPKALRQHRQESGL